MNRRPLLAAVTFGACFVTGVIAAPAVAQTFSLDFGSGGSTTGRVVQLVALLTVLSLAPSILVLVTSFTRIGGVLSFLRSAMGVQQTPPNAVLVSLALFLTAFVMGPTLETSYREGVLPLMEDDHRGGSVQPHACADPCFHAAPRARAGPPPFHGPRAEFSSPPRRRKRRFGR